MGLFDLLGKGLDALEPHRVTRRLQNEQLRNQIRQQNRQQQATQQLSGLLQPNTAGPGIQATPQQRDSRIMGLLSQIAPEAVATSMLRQEKPDRMTATMKEMDAFGFPRTAEGFRDFMVMKEQGSTVREDKPVSITDLARLELPDGSPVPPGTLYSELPRLGARIVTSDERKDATKKEAALRIVDHARSYADLFEVSPGLLNRVAAAGEAGRQLLTQENPRYAEYHSYVNGVLSPVVKALGESGALAEGDVGRASALFPEVFPFPDTKEVADSKFNALESILRPALRKHEQLTGEDLMSTFQRQAPAAPLNKLTDEQLRKLIEERRRRGS